MNFTLPKHGGYDEVMLEMEEHFNQFGWLTNPEGDDIPPDSIAQFTLSKQMLGDRVSYTISVFVTKEEFQSHSEFSVCSFVDIPGIRREDIESMEDIPDKEIKSMLEDKEAIGLGVGPKVFRNIIVADENKYLLQAAKILRLYTREYEEDF